MRDHLLLRCLCIALITFAIGACSDDDDDDDSTNNAPTADGSDLPNGGSTTSPVGKYVAEVTSVTLPTDTSEWDVFVGDSPAFVIDQDLSLKIVGLDEQSALEAMKLTTLAYDATNDWWRGVATETDAADGSITEETYTVSYDATAGNWQLTNGDKIDSDGDGTWDDASAIIATLHPRLDWSAKAGQWQFGQLQVDGDTGMLEAYASSVQFAAEGAFMGEGMLFYFYDDDGTLRSQGYDGSEVLDFVITKNQSDLMVMTLRSRSVPSILTAADPSGFAVGDTGEIHLVPMSRLATFAQTADLTVASVSEEDVDGDGSGYFGGEAPSVGSTISITLGSDGSHVVKAGSSTLEEGAYAYLDLAGGVLMGVVYEDDGGSNGYGIATIAVDGSGTVTGNARRDGYDFPDYDNDGVIDDDEFLDMEATGVIIFGSGVVTDDLDYVGMEDLILSAGG